MKKNITMKSIAATLAALTMMSPVSLAVYADEMITDPQIVISETPETTNTAAPEATADTSDAEGKPDDQNATEEASDTMTAEEADDTSDAESKPDNETADTTNTEEASAEETTDTADAEEAPADETTTEETTDTADAEEAPADETTAEETTDTADAEEAPADETTAEETTDTADAEEAPADETTAEETADTAAPESTNTNSNTAPASGVAETDYIAETQRIFDEYILPLTDESGYGYYTFAKTTGEKNYDVANEKYPTIITGGIYDQYRYIRIEMGWGADRRTCRDNFHVHRYAFKIKQFSDGSTEITGAGMADDDYFCQQISYISWEEFEQFITDRYEEGLAACEEGQALLEKEAEEARIRAELEEYNRIAAETRAKMDSMSVEEILEAWANIKKTPTPTTAEGTEAIDEVDEEKDRITAALENYGKELISEASEKLIDACPSPIDSLLKTPMTGMVNMALGKEEETSNDDVMQEIDKQAKILSKQIDDLKKSLIQSNKDMNSSTSHGIILDQYTDAADNARSQIDWIMTNRSLTTDNQRTVQIANILGKGDDITSSDLYKKMTSATRVLRGKPEADYDRRNLFELAYDIGKVESMFSGEAMDMTTAYLIHRIDTYIQNDITFLEILKAHQRLTEFTQEDIDALDDNTRAIYYNIVASDPYKVKCVITQIISNLVMSDEANEEAKSTYTEGIINKSKEYFTQSRFVYINKGEAYIPLTGKLDFHKDYELAFVPADKKNYESYHTHFYNLRWHEWVDRMGSLRDSDVTNIVKHAESKKKSLRTYLTEVGFDLSNIPDSNNILMATGMKYNGVDNTIDNLIHYSGWEGILGYDFNKCSSSEVKRGIIWHKRVMGYYTDHRKNYDANRDIVFFVSAENEPALWYEEQNFNPCPW